VIREIDLQHRSRHTPRLTSACWLERAAIERPLKKAPKALMSSSSSFLATDVIKMVELPASTHCQPKHIKLPLEIGSVLA
jgi:hypothetical protein